MCICVSVSVQESVFSKLLFSCCLGLFYFHNGLAHGFSFIDVILFRLLLLRILMWTSFNLSFLQGFGFADCFTWNSTRLLHRVRFYVFLCVFVGYLLRWSVSGSDARFVACLIYVLSCFTCWIIFKTRLFSSSRLFFFSFHFFSIWFLLTPLFSSLAFVLPDHQHFVLPLTVV